MVAEDYVSFEIAKLLKEKGFDEPTREFFDSKSGSSKEKEKIYGGVPDFGECYWNEDPFVQKGFTKFITFAKPSIAQVMKWLREVHNKSIEVRSQGLKATSLGWIVGIYNLVNQDEEFHHPYTFPAYEEACEAAIKYCLENLI